MSSIVNISVFLTPTDAVISNTVQQFCNSYTVSCHEFIPLVRLVHLCKQASGLIFFLIAHHFL